MEHIAKLRRSADRRPNLENSGPLRATPAPMLGRSNGDRIGFLMRIDTDFFERCHGHHRDVNPQLRIDPESGKNGEIHVKKRARPAATAS